MTFISLKTQLPQFTDVLSCTTADAIVQKLSGDKKNTQRLLQFVNRIINSRDWQNNKKLTELARSSMHVLQNNPPLHLDDLVFRRCQTAVQSLDGKKALLPNITTDTIKDRGPEEVVKEVGSRDKKNKKHDLLTLVNKIVHTIPQWQEDEELVDTVRYGLEYLTKNSTICTDPVVYKRCIRAMENFDKAQQTQIEETKEATNIPGIQNAGNTCYVGSVLQALKHSEGFVNALQNKDTSVANKIKELFVTLVGADDTEPRAVTKEEMKQFMETLSAEGHKEKKGAPGDPADLYSFLTAKSGISQVKYVHPQRGEVEDAYITVLEEEGRNTDVDVEDYIKKENIHFLSQDNLPSVLPVVINQMREGKQGNLAKIPYKIEVPILSDVTEETRCSYELKAIVTSGGHAITWVPMTIEGERKWIVYDDAKVTIVDDTEETRKNICNKAYVLVFDPIGIIN